MHQTRFATDKTSSHFRGADQHRTPNNHIQPCRAVRIHTFRHHDKSPQIIDTHQIYTVNFEVFIVDGKFNTRNYKAVDWLCTKIENGQTSLILDIQEFEED